ncbi:MAG: hypothetical protein H7Z39_08510 [Burkholderiaceae bacterium]|nr:hypothetical protein [Burkholderiaceae bacterium]
MTKLQVPYAEKDAAKALGARWDSKNKTWYVPPGTLLTPFEKWLPADAATPSDKPEKTAGKAAPAKVDSYIGKTVVGAHYFKLEHDCNPLEDCEICRPALEASGWAEAKRAALQAATARGG